MYKAFAAALIMIILACACETTDGKRSGEKASNGPVEIEVGGSIEIQSEYQGTN